MCDRLRMPTKHELMVARLTNIPTRGFCVNADLEQITAESYSYLYDPEEFDPPKLSPLERHRVKVNIVRVRDGKPKSIKE